MKKETLQDDERELDQDIVGLEEKISNNKKYYWAAVIAVLVICAAVFGTLAGTGAI